MASKNNNVSHDSEEEYEFSFQNAPPNLKPAFKHYATETLNTCELQLRIAIDTVDIDTALYYITQLTNYLELRYPMTRKTKAELCRLSLILLFEFPTDLMQQIVVMKLCTKLIKNENLSTVGFELDWKPFYNILRCTHFSSSQDGATQCDEKAILSSHGSKLESLILKAKCYFNCESFHEILDEILPYFNPNDIYYARAVHLVSLFLPTKQLWVAQQLRSYKIQSINDDETPHLLLYLLDQIFAETLWVESVPDELMSILIDIIKYNREFKVYLEPFLWQLFHHLYLNAELPINGRACILKKADRLGTNNSRIGTISALFASLKRFNRIGIQSIIELLVYMMDNRGNNDPVQLLFIEFFKNTTHYFYPDENRRTSSFSVKLTSILSSFTSNYATRYWTELRGYDNSTCVCYENLSTKLKEEVFSWHAQIDRKHPFYRKLDDRYKLRVSPQLFESLLPIIKWAIYAKSTYIKYGGYQAIKMLSTIFPQRTTMWAIDEVTECLSAVTASHRLSIGVGLLDSITPILLNRYLLPEVQPQFVDLLKAILFGIDPSLNRQCTITMSYLDSIFSKIPIIRGYDKELKEDDEDGYNDSIGMEVTHYFESFALCFVDKILSYARDSSMGLDTLKTSASSNHTPGIRNFVPRSNRILLKKFKKCVYSFWFSISKDIYIKCRDKVMHSIIDEPQCGELGAVIMTGMIFPYAQLSLDLVLPKLVDKILFYKDTKQRNTDKNMYKYDPDLYELRGSKEVLKYYLSLIEAVIIPSHALIIKYIPLLANIITIAMKCELPEIRKFAGPLLQSIIVTLTREVPLEMRPFSPHIWKEDNSWRHWRYWGQFTEIEMKRLFVKWRPNLKLKWFYPTEKEFTAIQQLIDYVLYQPLKDMDAFIEAQHEAPALNAQELMQYIRVLYHFCYGIGHLGDFDIDENAQLLPTIREDNYFKTPSNDKTHSYFVYQPSKDHNDAIYGTLNQLRSMLRLPFCTQYENVSLRTAFTRLSIRLYQKLSQYSDTADYVIDASELPFDEQSQDIEMSDDQSQSASSFSNINIRDILNTDAKEAEDNESADEAAAEKQRIKKSTLFPGVSKVLVWLNTFVNIIMNHDGVMWGVVSNLSAGYSRSKLLRKMVGNDLFTGHRHTYRGALVHEAHALTLKRLYFIFNYNSYTTDVRSLVEQLVKCSISEFQNVRNQAIHAIISGRSIYNFRSAIVWAFRFWLKIIKDNKSEKCQLLGATRALKNKELMTQIILRTPQRDREFISILLSGSIHREPLVQSAICRIFITYFQNKKYDTIYLPPNIARNEERQKEIEATNQNLKQEYQYMQQQLLSIAKNEKAFKSMNDNNSSQSSIDSSSFIKVTSTPNNPVVESVVSLIANLDVTSLNIDVSSFDINNVTPQSLSAFLSKQGFKLQPAMFESLSTKQLQSIIDTSPLYKFIRNKVESASAQDKAAKKEKKRVNVHWKYQLMATILLWKSLRPNMAPNVEVIEYILKLIGNEIPSLNRVALSSLTVIVHNYLPLLHYKDVIQNVDDYPTEHTFGWMQSHDKQKQITITDFNVSLPLYMRPSAQLSCGSAAIIHEYLSNNLDILCKAFASDHPNIVDPSAPPQNRRSSDTQLLNLIYLPHAWPYDGYDVTLDSWEHTHYILIRDILRCKWPASSSASATDTNNNNVEHWSYDDNLWNMNIEQFGVHSKIIKEKENQLAAGEILAGILRAYHHFAGIHKLPQTINTQILSNTITQPLLRIMQQCPQESEDAWCCAIRTGLANSDPSFVEWFTHPILRSVVENVQIQHVDNNDNNDKQMYVSPDKQVRAMRYGTEILVSYGYRGEKEWRYILSSLVFPCAKIKFNDDEFKQEKEIDTNYTMFDCYFANTYRSVRGDIGILLAHIVRCLRTKPIPLLSIYDVTSSDPQFSSIILMIETRYLLLWKQQNEEQQQVKKHDSHEKSSKFTKKYDNFLQTLCFWLLQCYNNLHVIYYQSLFVRLLPLILCGAYREDKKTVEVVSMTTEVIAWSCLYESQVLQIFDILLDICRTPKLINNPSWKIRKVVLQFLLQFICRNAVILNKNWKYQELIVDYLILNALKDKQLEVRSVAQNVLTALIQSTSLKHVEKIKILQQRFEKLARTKLPKRNYEKAESGFNKKLNLKLRKKHCGILGLSSLILSVPYLCPKWLPEILSFISVFDHERAPIGTTVKKTVAEFKRTHSDEWHIFQKQFTLDQLSNIQDASSTSYFV